VKVLQEYTGGRNKGQQTERRICSTALPAQTYKLSLLVDFSTMTDGMYDDDSFASVDLEDDAIGPFSKLVEPLKFSFEWEKPRRVEVLREPADALNDASTSRLVKFLEFFGG
jgi:hypothetical protein